MKKNIIFLLFFVFLFSCQSSINGIYKKKGHDFEYVLILKPNNKFLFQKKYFEVNSSCQGDWEKKGDSIFLKCKSDEDLSEQLSRGYMTQRNFKLKLEKGNTLKIDSLILQK